MVSWPIWTAAQSNYAEELAPTTPPHSVEPTAQVMAVRWKQIAPTKSPIALKAATASPGGAGGGGEVTWKIGDQSVEEHSERKYEDLKKHEL